MVQFSHNISNGDMVQKKEGYYGKTEFYDNLGSRYGSGNV